jgi:hypothetical protein
MVLCVVNSLQANRFNLTILIIKAFVINLKLGLYVRLLNVKVYIIVFVRELIKIIYLSLILCVYNIYI